MQASPHKKKLPNMMEIGRVKVPLFVKTSLITSLLTFIVASIIGLTFYSELIKLDIVQDSHLIESIEEIKINILIISLVLSFVVFVISIVIVKRIVKPLTVMTDLILSDGLLEIKKGLPVDATNEVGVLARAFNNLNIVNEFKEQQVTSQKYSIDQHAIVSVTDTDGNYIFVNSQLEKVSGYTPNELLGKHHSILSSENNHSKLLEKMYQTIAEGKVWKGELCHVSKSGKEYWLDSTIVPILDSSGLPYQYIAVLTNITKAKKNLLALKVSQERLALSSSIANDGLWDWDIKLNTVVFDDRYYLMAGYQPSDFKAGFSEWDKRVHIDDIKRVKESVENYIKGKSSVYDSEFRFLKKDNSYMWIRGKGRIVGYSNDNVPTRMIGTHQDISDIKAFESDLINAKEKAEKAVQSKSEFFASMSHEIRTPMNGVLGMLGLMMQTDLNKQQKHYATLARSSADSLLAIIDDILDLSKIDAGKIELEAIDFDLKEQLGIFAESMAYRAQDKGLELVLDISEIKHTLVNGDPSRLRQILTNLVGNAIKFTENGHVKIKGALELFNENEWMFHCEVSDTGMGILKEHVNSLFDSYSQVDSSTTRKFGGTGLGLAIVKQLTSLMNGDVKVNSEYGSSSTFIFKVKVGVSSQSEIELPKLDISNKKILVVDNNKENLMAIIKQLKEWGAVVVPANCGLQAIEILREQYSTCEDYFDLAIIDMDMPTMNGVALGKILKDNNKYNKLKLVMMTSMEGSGDVSQFMNLGFSAYFPKPATTSDLFHALEVLSEKNESDLSDYNEKYHQISGANIFSNAHLLLVEDNPINQAVAEGILSGMGISVDIAEDGLEAIEMLKNNQINYGLVLMDCQMPEMDGYEATIAIRSEKYEIKNPKIPIIAMTANALKGDREYCLKVGMDDYLTKPVDPNALEEMLRYWLPKGQQGHHLKITKDKEKKLLNSDISTSKNRKPLTERAVEMESKIKADVKKINEDKETVWDKKALMGRVRNNEKLAGKLVQLFLNDLPNLLESLKVAVKSEVMDDIAAHAHRIKGSASNLSAIAVSKTSAKIEKASRAEDLLSVVGEMDLFEKQVLELLICLEEDNKKEN
jgi:two-component system sensor histidine kinase/response regulator